MNNEELEIEIDYAFGFEEACDAIEEICDKFGLKFSFNDEGTSRAYTITKVSQ